MQGWLNICKTINIIMHIRTRQKSHGHLNRYRKSSSFLHDKSSARLGVERIYINIVKVIYDIPTANIVQNSKKAVHLETQETMNSQGNTQQKEQCWRYHNTQLQSILQSNSNKNSMALAQKQT
jgi:hypothetical protein